MSEPSSLLEDDARSPLSPQSLHPKPRPDGYGKKTPGGAGTHTTVTVQYKKEYM